MIADQIIGCSFVCCLLVFFSSAYPALSQLNSGWAIVQDFSGFRVVVLFSRFRPNWPAPGAYDTEGEKADERLGAEKRPIPMLLMDGKPVSAATVRW